MKLPPEQHRAFDNFAESYDSALEQGLSVSGENKHYYAQGRVRWLAARLLRLGLAPHAVLDFGCGTGTSAPLLLSLAGVRHVTGVDPSPRSLQVARQQHGSPQIEFLPNSELVPAGQFCLAFCNGVFHHIPPQERAEAVRFIFQALRPGGVFALWENNPWNPGTRYVMSRIPFDRDAQTLSAPETRRMLRAGGFQILGTDFLFYFPRWLRWLRPVEPWLCRLPLGAQYQVLARKPGQGDPR